MIRRSVARAPRLAAVWLWGALAVPAIAPAQDTGGALLGRVEAGDGTPLPGVRVAVSSPSLLGSRAIVTDPGGSFRLSGLPGGKYDVALTLIGYRAVVVRGVPVALGRTTPLAGGVVRLEPAPVPLEPLVISADASPIDVSTPAVQTTLSADAFLAVPSQRDYRDLLKLVPQANESFLGDPVNVAGATGLENLTFIDGLNATDPFFGSRGTKLPYNFVREIQVKSGGYEAEYGGALGGIFNVVTRSGGDRWAFSGFGFFNNSSLTSDATLGAADLVARGADVYDFGLAVGGPLIHDRLSLFAAYDPSFAREEVAIRGHGFFGDEITEHLFAAKLNWRATANSDVALSVFGDPKTWDRVGGGPFTQPDTLLGPGPLLNRVEDGGVNVNLEASHPIGATAVLDAGLGYSYRDFFDGPRPGDEEPRYVFVPTGAIGGGFGEFFSYRGQRVAARIAGTWLLRSHTIKAGLEYEQASLSPYRTGNPGVGVILDFGPDADEACVEASFACRYWVIFLDDGGGADLRSRTPTAYVQDSWEISRHFRLNYGLRWEAQYLIDSEGRVGQSFPNEWQPRVGFVWQPGEPGTQKVTGSAGRYYQQMALRLASNFYNGAPRNGIEAWRGDPRTSGVPVDTLGVFCCSIQPRRDLSGTHFDELTLGYERLLGGKVRLGAKGILRTLREVVTIGTEAPPGTSQIGNIVGNPGSGDLDFLEKAERDYYALELTLDWSGRDDLQLSASYVLSRTEGNYPGLYDSDARLLFPNQSSIFERVEQMPQNDGLLPNDRPHAFKLWGAYRFGFGLQAGTFFTVQSGTPLSRYRTIDIAFRQAFLSPRGSEGRTPTIWDLSFRLQYPIRLGRAVGGGRQGVAPAEGSKGAARGEPDSIERRGSQPTGHRGWRATGRRGWRANLIADFLHVGNPQTVVLIDQLQELEMGLPNPTFGEPLAFQRPFTVRVGVEIGF